MRKTVAEIAALVGGKLHGNGGAFIEGAAGLSEASASDVSFLRDTKNQAAVHSFETSAAGAVIVPAGLTPNGKTVIEVASPMKAFAMVLSAIAEEKAVRPAGVHPTAVVAPSARIGANAAIGPFCVVEEGAVIGEGACLMAQVYVGARSTVGAQSLLYPQVVLREEVSVGARCIVHAGAVIGSDGYGFFFESGRHNKIPQVGGVVIEDDVEIGSCTTIDRAMTGTTRIRRGTKIDNLVQVAHNVEVGEHNLLAAQSGIAGSTRLGRGVVFGGQVGVADHTVVGDGVQVGAQSGVKGDIPAGSVLFGSPAQPIQDTLKQTLLIRRLPELFKDFKKLKESITKDV